MSLVLRKGTVSLDTWKRVGKQLKTYYTEHGPEKVPVKFFHMEYD